MNESESRKTGTNYGRRLKLYIAHYYFICMRNSKCISFIFMAFHLLSASPVLTIHKIIAGSNVYLIESDSTLVLIDSGYPGKEKRIISKIDSLSDKKLTLIFITHGHFDHYGSAQLLRKKYGAQIGIHKLDSTFMANGETPLPKTKNGGFFGKISMPLVNKIFRVQKTEPDITFEHNDTLEQFGIDAKVIHVPGHTLGSSALLLENKHCFIGDLISTQKGIQKQKWYAYSWKQIDSSINLLKKLAPQILYPGHGKNTISYDALKPL